MNNMPTIATDDECSGQTIRSAFTGIASLTQVIARYVLALPNCAAQLNRLLKDRRTADLRRIVHQLKGSGGTYGFSKISDLAEAAESAIDSKADIETVAVHVQRLIGLLRRVDGYERAAESFAE